MSKKRGPGRPKMKKDDKRKPWGVPFNKAERDLVEQAAAKAGLPVATWCRDTLLEAARK